MRFNSTVIEALDGLQPPVVMHSEAIEAQLEPCYSRFGLRTGRLELMTGIRERRFWEKPVRASQASTQAAEALLTRRPELRAPIELIVHCGVCRDRMEPATAAYVHEALGLQPHCQILDLSNACLGFCNALVLVAGLIEAGQIRRALLVSGEDGRPLLERTIAQLNALEGPRAAIKPFFANLTIGAGAVAAVLSHRTVAEAPLFALQAASSGTDSQANRLCQGDHSTESVGLEMATDAEALLEAGIALAGTVWKAFLAESGLDAASIDRVVTHQVGRAHQRRLLEALGLPEEREFCTYPTLGNTGSVAAPLTLYEARRCGFIRPGERVALMGIGSGLSCLMLALEALA